MITNELQYRVTKSEVQKFEMAMEGLKQKPLGKTDPLVRKAQLEGMKSQLEDLQRELADYEALKGNKRKEFNAASLTELPLALIQVRIARGLTQENLAMKLGVSKQQVQRDEENLYDGASLQRLDKIAEMLGVKVATKLELV
jgi:HTH-type transcriptional regulator / antitoxin HipB